MTARGARFQKAIDLDTGNVWTADLLGNLSYALKNWATMPRRGAPPMRRATPRARSSPSPEGAEPLLACVSDLGTALVPDSAGFVTIDAAKYHEVFAGDLPRRQTQAMAVAQKPIFAKIFGHRRKRPPGRPPRAGTSSRSRTGR
jgi:hypothetical protein